MSRTTGVPIAKKINKRQKKQRLFPIFWEKPLLFKALGAF
jgi:hypothetical protein